MKNLFASLMLLMAFGAATVSQAQALDPDVLKRLTDKLSLPAHGLVVQRVAPTPIADIYEVSFVDGPTVYALSSGNYFVAGDLYSLTGGELVNLAEQRRSHERKAQLDDIDPKKLIVFPAKGAKRATVNVFTDITCYYCQQLHNEVPALNKAGVEVRYLAWPRGGVGSQGFRLLATAWCAKDKQDALTQMKNKKNLPENVCPGNPVAAQFELGKQMGVRATPSIMLESGELIPGYQTTDQLLTRLGLAN